MLTPDDRTNMTTSETGQPQHETIGAAAVQARRTCARTAAVMFFASLVLMIGASLGLGFLLGRASSVLSGATPTSVSNQSPAAGAAKTEPQIKATILPGKVNEETLAATVDQPANTPVSLELSPNVGAIESGAESRDITKSQVLAADFEHVGAIQQPVPLEAKEEATVTILKPASDPTLDAPSRNAQHWLKLAEEVRHQAEESTRAAGKRLLLKIANTYERLAKLAPADTAEATAEATAEEKPRRRHRSRR
jgi:hypothetical protein